MRAMIPILILLLFPQTAVASSEIAWRFSSDSNLSPPCVYEMLVFVGSEDGRFFALYAHSGRIRWLRHVEGKIFASAARGGRAFACTSEGIFCFNADNGDLFWKFEMKDLVRRTPIVGENTVFVASHEGHVACLGFDGILRWEKDLNENVTSQPILLGDSLVVATLEGNLFFLDISNGTQRRTISLSRACSMISDFTIAENVAYLCSDDSLLAVSIDSGEILWMRSLSCVTKPSVLGGGVCIGTPTSLVFLSKETGEIIWEVETRERPFFVVFETETILVGTRAGLKKYDLNGNVVWEMKIGAVVYPPVLLYEKIFVLVSQNEILCIGSWGEAGETGKEMGYVYLAIAIACGFMLVLLDVLLPERRVVKRRKYVRKAKRGRRRSGGVAGI